MGVDSGPADTPGFHSLGPEDETVVTSLPVEGTVPEWLRGSLIRNGPGAFEADGHRLSHWFDGLAMLRKFTFDGRGTVAYRNRFLRTDAYRNAHDGDPAAGFATEGTSFVARLRTFLANAAYDNTNVIVERFGDRYYALTESPRRIVVDPTTLETAGYVEYAGEAPAGQVVCAHLQRDPWTGSAINLDTDFGRTSAYHVYRTDAPNRRAHITSIDVREPAYMHSFALTKHHVVLTEFPFVIDPLGLLRPGNDGPFIDNYEWKPERGTRFVVIDRRSGDVVAEPHTDAFFGFHHVNAYEAAPGELVIDLETLPDATAVDSLYVEDLRRGGGMGATSGAIDRFRVRLGHGDARIERERLYGGGTGLPTVSPAVRCRKHRYVYAQGTDQPPTDWPGEVVKLDTETREVCRFDPPNGYPSEPIFVPRPDGSAEDDGVVLTVVLDAEADRSYLAVLDGATLTERARARLPHALPFDFHGRFFPELDRAPGAQ